MLTVYGDRPHFYQWDLDQRLIVDNPDVIEVHFSNTRVKPALICEVYEEAGVRYANVPNILLQQPLAVMAHGCCAECVRDELIIRVVGRTKPADYIYTETEIRSFESLQKRVEDVADRAEAATEEAEASAQASADAAAQSAADAKKAGSSAALAWLAEGNVQDAKDAAEAAADAAAKDAAEVAEGISKAAENAAAASAAANTSASQAAAANTSASQAASSASAAAKSAATAEKAVQDAVADAKASARASADAAAQSAANAKTTVEGAAAEAKASAQASAEAAAKSAANAEKAVQDAVADAKASAEASATRSEAAADRAEAAMESRAQIDDASMSFDRVWSSRSTVERLCPEFSTRGGIATCYPVERYPLQVVSHVEVTQGGSGDPSPDNIRPIKNYTSLPLNRCSKNLLNIANKSAASYGVSVKITDGILRMDGVSTGAATGAVSLASISLPAGTYTLSYRVISGDVSDVGTVIRLTNTVKASEVYSTTAAEPVLRFSLPETRSFTVFVLTAKSPAVYNAFTIAPQLEVGGSATEWELYHGDVFAATLEEAICAGRYDWAAGTLSSDWVFKTLDGTEGWVAVGSGIYTYYALTVDKFQAGVSDVIVCSHFPAAVIAGGTTVQGCRAVNSAGYNDFRLMFRPDVTVYDTVAKWKAFLTEQSAAGTPVQAAYRRVESVEKQIAAPQTIPALGGVNNLWIDGGETEVSGRADPGHVIEALGARLAAIENAVINNI